MLQVIGFLPLLWETWMEIRLPALPGLAAGGIRGENKQMVDPSLSVLLALSLCLSINYLKNKLPSKRALPSPAQGSTGALWGNAPSSLAAERRGGAAFTQ